MKKLILSFAFFIIGQSSFAVEYHCFPEVGNDTIGLGEFNMAILPKTIVLNHPVETCEIRRSTYAVLDNGLYRYISEPEYCSSRMVQALDILSIKNFDGDLKVWRNKKVARYFCNPRARHTSDDEISPNSNSQ